MQYHLTLLSLLVMLLFSVHLQARNYSPPKENWYQEVWCLGKSGVVEHKLEDGRRVDCLTSDYAIEVEFARKWSEGIGQSMDYSMLTGKKAGIVLILKKPSDHKYWKRLNTLIDHYRLPITVWKPGLTHQTEPRMKVSNN